MVVVGKDSLEREGAAAFVAVVCEAFYEVSKAIDDAERGDEVLVALGEKFSDLNLEDMKLVVQQTVFYKSPDEARELLTGDAFRNTMDIVGQFCRKHGLIQEEPSIGFGQDAPNARLIFDATYLPE